jgi:hypothetical protein
MNQALSELSYTPRLRGLGSERAGEGFNFGLADALAMGGHFVVPVAAAVRSRSVP